MRKVSTLITMVLLLGGTGFASAEELLTRGTYLKPERAAKAAAARVLNETPHVMDVIGRVVPRELEIVSPVSGSGGRRHMVVGGRRIGPTRIPIDVVRTGVRKGEGWKGVRWPVRIFNAPNYL
jgi:hypothetical protein